MATSVKPLVVEFIGLPGAGKTTVSRQVADALTAEGWHVVQRKDYYEWTPRCTLSVKIRARSIGYLRRLPITLQFLWHIGMRHPRQRGPLSFGHMIAINHAYLEEFLRDVRADVCLLEQWTLQSVWSVGTMYHEAKGDALLPLARVIIATDPHLYVYFHLPPEAAAQRIATRSHGGSRFDHREPREVEEQLQQFQHLFEPILRAIEEQKRPLLYLAADEPVSHQVHQIVHWVKQHMR